MQHRAVRRSWRRCHNPSARPRWWIQHSDSTPANGYAAVRCVLVRPAETPRPAHRDDETANGATRVLVRGAQEPRCMPTSEVVHRLALGGPASCRFEPGTARAERKGSSVAPLRSATPRPRQTLALAPWRRAWPSLSDPRTPAVCDRCVRPPAVPRSFVAFNSSPRGRRVEARMLIPGGPTGPTTGGGRRDQREHGPGEQQGDGRDAPRPPARRARRRGRPRAASRVASGRRHRRGRPGLRRSWAMNLNSLRSSSWCCNASQYARKATGRRGAPRPAPWGSRHRITD